MIAKTIKLIAKIRDNHKKYNENKSKYVLRQIFALIPKAKEDLKQLSQINTPYKWRDRFVFVATDYLNEFVSAFTPKLKSTHLHETSETLDNALDWLFKNIPELNSNN